MKNLPLLANIGAKLQPVNRRDGEMQGPQSITPQVSHPSQSPSDVMRPHGLVMMGSFFFPSREPVRTHILHTWTYKSICPGKGGDRDSYPLVGTGRRGGSVSVSILPTYH